jgi:hypothetical protein
VLPHDLKSADTHLNALIYECLQSEDWKRAEMLSEFALGQPRTSDEFTKRVFLVNHCLALKWGGVPEEAAKKVRSVDWTASAAEFRLAEAVLTDQFDAAEGLMRAVGKDSQTLGQNEYQEWPLFREFRTSAQFGRAYREIFGQSFSEVATQSAGHVVSEAKDIAGSR